MDIELGSAALTLPVVDVAALSQSARVDALVELQRAKAWADALEQRLLAGLVEPGEAPRRSRVSEAVAAKQYVREEIACALRLSPMTVNERLHVARILVGELAATLAAVETGELTLRHARILADAVAPLDVTARAAVEARVLDRGRSQTPSQFRQTVARAVLAADPRSADDRHEAARSERDVQTRMLPDAMGALHATLSADDLQAVREVIAAAADAHPEHDEHCERVVGGRATRACPDAGCASCVSRARTAGQRRADALVGLLLGLDVASVQSRHGRAPSVQVSVALSTLLDLDDQPGEMDGYGPIPADVARRMAGDPSGTWRRLVTDDLGHLVDYGRSTYRPPQDLTDHVLARDRTCRFPGCNWQARACELDHLLDWDLGGHTNECNLLAGCPRHHHLRHDAGWRVQGDPAGTLSWITPTGHAYDDPIGEYPVDTTTANTRGDPDSPPNGDADEATVSGQTGTGEQTERAQPGDLAHVITWADDEPPPF